MGPLFVAMPRTNYQGAFAGGVSSSQSIASSSKLIGSDDDEECMTARQISSRLSQKLKIPVFVSCSLSKGIPQLLVDGMDHNMVQQHASALTEKEICHILLKQQRLL